MIYGRFPHRASIYVNQDPISLLQPVISLTCKRMRQECLDVYYSKNNFFLDLRGYSSSAYPRAWTPTQIFEKWATAIGDENAARLRSFSFFSHNFSASIKLSNKKPRTLVLKFRSSEPKVKDPGLVDSSYSFAIAAQRAEQGLQLLLEDVQADMPNGGLTVNGLIRVCRAVGNVQPFLCTSVGTLGYGGFALKENKMSIEEWPSTQAHRRVCYQCK